MSDHILKVTLAHIRPAIWRRLTVPGDYTLADLHEVLQIAFGWENRHLYRFSIGKDRYGIPDLDEATDEVDADSISVAQVFRRKGSRADYLYDFGDGWTHEINVEDIEQRDSARRPSCRSAPVVCLDGRRAAPPEDCGGPYAYSEFLEALGDCEHERHAELVEWTGGDFDPEYFSPLEVNRHLAAFRR